MTKRIFSIDKGWVTVEPEPSAGQAEDIAARAPSSVFDDEVKEPETFKLPFKKIMNNHIIIKIDRFKYKGRVKIPDSAKGQPTTGTVLAVDEALTDIAVGDKILYSQFGGYLLRFRGLPLMRCISREEVLSSLNEDAPETETEG